MTVAINRTERSESPGAVIAKSSLNPHHNLDHERRKDSEQTA